MDLPKVQRGEPVTAEAWNQVVAAINGTPNVSLIRGKRTPKASADFNIVGTSPINVTLTTANNVKTFTVSKSETTELKYWTIGNDSVNVERDRIVFDSAYFTKYHPSWSDSAYVVGLNLSNVRPTFSLTVADNVITISLT